MNNNSYKIWYLNARSIYNKIEEIEIILEKIPTKIHFIMVTEHWLVDNDTKINNTKSLNLKNYQSVLSARKDRRGGGAGILVHKDIKFDEKVNFCNEEISFVTIKTHNKDKSICFYN